MIPIADTDSDSDIEGPPYRAVKYRLTDPSLEQQNLSGSWQIRGPNLLTVARVYLS
jgi:hypothetical protein